MRGRRPKPDRNLCTERYRLRRIMTFYVTPARTRPAAGSTGLHKIRYALHTGDVKCNPSMLSNPSGDSTKIS